MTSSARSTIGKIGLTGAVLAGLWLLAAPFIGTFLIVERRLAGADAIIVLSGSAVYKDRNRKAAELYAQGIGKRVFLTDDGKRSGWSQSEQRNIPYVELAKRELETQGVPAGSIEILPDEVSGTDDEARRLGAAMDRYPIKTITIVTSPYHTRRSLLVFEQILAGRGVEFGIEHTGGNTLDPQPTGWWLSIAGWGSVGGEYLKLAAYWAYY